MAYWKSPRENKWYQIVVNGQLLGVLEESKSTIKELERLQGLPETEIQPASNEALLRFNTSTALPTRIIRKMADLYKNTRI